MPSISPEISLKVTNLLKTMGKLSEPMIAEAKKNMMVMEKRHLVFCIT